MRKAMAVAIFLAAFAASLPAQPAAKKTDKEFSADFWRDRTRQLLEENFPDHQALVKSLVIKIEIDDAPYAFSRPCRVLKCDDLPAPIIIVSSGLILGLLNSRWGDDGYLAVLDHEMGHIILKHPSAFVRSPGSRFPDIDPDIYNTNEHGADRFALELLPEQGRSPCVLKGLFIITDQGMHWSVAKGPLKPINLHRWAVVKKACVDYRTRARSRWAWKIFLSHRLCSELKRRPLATGRRFFC